MCGWRVEKEKEKGKEGREEDVLVCGRESVEYHGGIAEIERFGDFARIQGSRNGAAMKCARKMEV